MKGYGTTRTIREFIEATKHLSQQERIKSWVVGRGIYQAKDKRAAAIEHTSQLY